jgi:hypothetical protein
MLPLHQVAHLLHLEAVRAQLYRARAADVADPPAVPALPPCAGVFVVPGAFGVRRPTLEVTN